MYMYLVQLSFDCVHQVTIEYRNVQGACVPVRVHTVVVSVQHSPDISLPEMKKQLKEILIEVLS